MSAVDWVFLVAGFALAASKVTTIVIARAFCARPIPQMFRLVQEGVLVLLGLRWMQSSLFDVARDWQGAAVAALLGGIGVVVMLANARRVFVYGDHCPRDPFKNASTSSQSLGRTTP